ncbi:general stress protein [Brachybacterium avium]|uniref:general stress protein n=1 Tax=Brachybacterium avium TaxID=2017485 RepID=UPI001FEA240E|nr:general stress protein [Brachybacterium avium]
MSQPPQSPRSASPLTARLYDLEYPRSLGVYSTYQEVQSVVDTLADRQFPVQSTLIVGTDLKLMERVTGRRTWPKVISQGALSGLWMGLFLGLLLLLLSPGNLTVVLTAVVLGIVFFTVSSVIGYAMTGGRRDFTSMTATIPMQYELLVEHKHAAQAQQILAESGAAPVPVRGPAASGAEQFSQQTAPYGHTSHSGGQQFGSPAARPGASSPMTPPPGRPSYGQPAQTSPAPSGGPPPAAAGRASACLRGRRCVRTPLRSSCPMDRRRSAHPAPPKPPLKRAALVVARHIRPRTPPILRSRPSAPRRGRRPRIPHPIGAHPGTGAPATTASAEPLPRTAGTAISSPPDDETSSPPGGCVSPQLHTPP